jgi:hypothetical protein
VKRARPCAWGRTVRVCLHGWIFLSCESRTDARDDVRIQSGRRFEVSRFSIPALGIVSSFTTGFSSFRDNGISSLIVGNGSCLELNSMMILNSHVGRDAGWRNATLLWLVMRNWKLKVEGGYLYRGYFEMKVFEIAN